VWNPLHGRERNLPQFEECVHKWTDVSFGISARNEALGGGAPAKGLCRCLKAGPLY